MNDIIFDKKAPIVASFEECAREIKKETNAYLTTFNGDGILSFLASESDKTKYFDRYNAFAARLSEAIGKLEGHVSSLSRLVCEADGACEREATEELVELFDICQEFLGALLRFNENNQRNFDKNGVFKASLSLNYAREFKSAVDIFEKKING